MFTKATLFKFALVPLAAATALSHSVSATPAASSQLQVCDGSDGPHPGGGDWSNGKTDCECAWDKDHVPQIAKPCQDTVWRVGERQKVFWEKKGDGWKHNGTDGKHWGYGKRDDKDGQDWDDGKDHEDGQGWDDGKDHKRRPCKTRLLLRKGDAKPFVILAEDFDVKAGFVEVTVPNVFHGEDYRVTLIARDDKPELESCSDKFKIVKGDRHWHKDCKDECKPEDDRECCKHKDGKDGKDGDY